jgi:hypothetical protein
MRKVLVILLIFILFGTTSAYLFTGTPVWGPKFTPKNTAVKTIELSWMGESRTIRNSDQCAEVLQMMRKARQYPVPTSPPFGSMILHYADGTTNKYFLQPSGRISSLEIVGESGGYAISMNQMLSVFKKVGLLAKDPR